MDGFAVYTRCTIPCVEELVFDIDDKLFNCILSDKHHVLYQLLPPERHSGSAATYLDQENMNSV